MAKRHWATEHKTNNPGTPTLPMAPAIPQSSSGPMGSSAPSGMRLRMSADCSDTAVHNAARCRSPTPRCTNFTR
eukprot:12223025-Alexandrium_andersonii.AAC.1